MVMITAVSASLISKWVTIYLQVVFSYVRFYTTWTVPSIYNWSGLICPSLGTSPEVSCGVVICCICPSFSFGIFGKLETTSFFRTLILIFPDYVTGVVLRPGPTWLLTLIFTSLGILDILLDRITLWIFLMGMLLHLLVVQALSFG